MNKNSKLMEVASRLWPNSHGRYEEMCALAATGQLGGAQMCELNEHIATCDSCRKFLESVAQVSVQAMPLLADNRAPAADIVPREGMRARFLSRLAAGELNTKGGAVHLPQPVLIQKPLSVAPDKQYEGDRRKEEYERSSRVRFALLAPLWRPAAALAVCAIVGLAGLYVGEWRGKQTTQKMTELHSSGTLISQGDTTADSSDRLRQLERQKSELEGGLARLKEKLLNAEAERASLSDELAAAKDKLAAFTSQAQSASPRSLVEDQEANNQVATLQVQVDRLSQRLAESEVKLAVQQQTTEELTAKLEAAEADLQRERDLKSAKSELGDLVAARNLHIVDVYDADGKGKRQRAFGRVFYIEGKSLVFYAYDLEDPRRLNANVVFRVWGEKAGTKATTHSLGILHNDDASQGRWAMTFDDPKVLAQINSVFVTAEAANKHYDLPHGKKVLYAYFGSQPNHP